MLTPAWRQALGQAFPKHSLLVGRIGTCRASAQGILFPFLQAHRFCCAGGRPRSHAECLCMLARSVVLSGQVMPSRLSIFLNSTSDLKAGQGRKGILTTESHWQVWHTCSSFVRFLCCFPWCLCCIFLSKKGLEPTESTRAIKRGSACGRPGLTVPGYEGFKLTVCVQGVSLTAKVSCKEFYVCMANACAGGGGMLSKMHNNPEDALMWARCYLQADN